jgi:predicted ribosome quality control (RQC) complex YloA/Tae2 family protein
MNYLPYEKFPSRKWKSSRDKDLRDDPKYPPSSSFKGGYVGREDMFIQLYVYHYVVDGFTEFREKDAQRIEQLERALEQRKEQETIKEHEETIKKQEETIKELEKKLEVLNDCFSIYKTVRN